MAIDRMAEDDEGFARADTDASLLTERRNTDRELKRRVVVADADADEVLRIARERADRLLLAARAAADARLPLDEQTEAAVALLLNQRAAEDWTLANERAEADQRLELEREERREKLSALLVLERQTTDLHLALERRSSDFAVASRDDFLALASHDLRALLAAQKLHFALLIKQAGDAETRRKLVRQTATLTEINAQLDRLIGDLIDVVAIDAGKLTVTAAPRSANDTLTTTIAVFQPLAAERRQSLVATPLSTDASVHADGVRVVQVLGNLLSNAIKFTPADGEIRVGAEAGADQIVFFVADTGPGVAADQAVHIFERFVGSTSSPRGLGLGLYIAKRLIDAHGGRIWLDSRPGEGAVFRFSLPRAASRSP